MQRAQHRLSRMSQAELASRIGSDGFRNVAFRSVVPDNRPECCCEWHRDAQAGLVPQLEFPILLFSSFGQRPSPFGTSQSPLIQRGVARSHGPLEGEAS